MEHINPFCGATDTPALDFWWYLSWVLKLGWIPLIVCFIACMEQNPQIHLWCDNCWPLGSQHGTWAILIHVFVNKHWWGLRLGSIVHAAASQCETRQMVSRLSYACSTIRTIIYFIRSCRYSNFKLNCFVTLRYKETMMCYEIMLSMEIPTDTPMSTKVYN